jgi:glutamate/tyrosine decarboxylase-like PLP-dependent enzyme
MQATGAVPDGDSPFAPAGDPLALDPEAMRALGHQTVDALVDLLTDPGTPCLRHASADEMARRVPAAVPESGRPLDALLDQLANDVFPFMSRLDHPGYFAYIPACGTFPGALGDFMASAMNLDVGTWAQSAGPSRVELVVLDWFKHWIGYPDEAAGVLVSGGSAANMTALACARETLLGPVSPRAVAYVSDQAHSSLARAARALGFGPDELRVLPAGADGRMRPETVAAAIDADARAGHKPLFVAAAAGTTSTGAVDPLAELAQVCRARGVWFHVDAAYGGFAALTERGRAALRGIDQADSVTLDPHKWLYQPFECGCVLVREGPRLRQAFHIAPDYLKDTLGEDDEVNFADRGLQLSRTSHAIKVWLSVSFFGADAFRRAIDRTLDLAQLAERHVRASDALELMSPASLGVICFRRRGADGEDERAVAAGNAALVAEYEATGQGLVSSTRLRGRYAIRLCAMNHTSTEDHVRSVVDWFANAPEPEQPTPARRPSGRSVVAGEDRWLNVGAFKTAKLRAVPLFASLPPEDLERLGRWARKAVIPAGETVTRRWGSARDFYVVLDGHARVERDGEPIAECGPGDFFGELAALDWGAGFGYARLATVTAVEPLCLLVLAPAHLSQLMAASPDVDERIRTVAAERLGSVAD